MLLSLLTPLSDHVHPEGLALLAKCSKEAHSLATPLLALQMRDKEKVRLMILRYFPTLTGLPADRDVAYYRVLFNRYFSGVILGAPATQVEVSFAIGHALELTAYCTVRDMTQCVLPPMQSARGRKMIRAAIAEWRAALLLRPMDHVEAHKRLLLDDMERGLQTDFVVLFDLINSRFDWRVGHASN